jgi:hypothetical protein
MLESMNKASITGTSETQPTMHTLSESFQDIGFAELQSKIAEIIEPSIDLADKQVDPESEPGTVNAEIESLRATAIQIEIREFIDGLQIETMNTEKLSTLPVAASMETAFRKLLDTSSHNIIDSTDPFSELVPTQTEAEQKMPKYSGQSRELAHLFSSLVERRRLALDSTPEA